MLVVKNHYFQSNPGAQETNDSNPAEDLNAKELTEEEDDKNVTVVFDGDNKEEVIDKETIRKETKEDVDKDIKEKTDKECSGEEDTEEVEKKIDTIVNIHIEEEDCDELNMDYNSLESEEVDNKIETGVKTREELTNEETSSLSLEIEVERKDSRTIDSDKDLIIENEVNEIDTKVEGRKDVKTNDRNKTNETNCN